METREARGELISRASLALEWHDVLRRLTRQPAPTFQFPSDQACVVDSDCELLMLSGCCHMGFRVLSWRDPESAAAVVAHVVSQPRLDCRSVVCTTSLPPLPPDTISCTNGRCLAVTSNLAY